MSPPPHGAPPPAPRVGKADIAQIAAALSAVIGVFTGLAVSGILGQAQRNHGIYLLIAFSLVLFSAVLWIAIALPNVPPIGRYKGWVQLVAILLFAGGLGVGIFALIETQRDAERPAVSATFARGTRLLTAHATAHGLSSDDRLVVLVAGLSSKKGSPFVLIEDYRSLYYAELGPDAAGDVQQDVSVYVPKTYTAIAVKAWTGQNETICRTEQVLATKQTLEHVSQHARAGCLLMRIPGRGR